MKLSQLFTGRSQAENRVEENGRPTQSQHARMADLNRQIHSLVPGQTIRGEIVSRNGSEVQIRLSDDMVMNAKVDQSINLELGKNVTFEVKSNGGTLSLSPLFTNIAADANVLKALDMAGLPVNDISVSMTEQMMKAGLSVSRNSLQQVYREINRFSDNNDLQGIKDSTAGKVSDVVDLHRLQLPVNKATMQQMESYRNLTHQLIKGMTSILDALPEAVNGMLAEGNDEGAAGLYRELFSMLSQEIMLSQESMISKESMPPQEGMISKESMPPQEGMISKESMPSEEGMISKESMLSEEGIISKESMLSEEGMISKESMLSEEGMISKEGMLSEESMISKESMLSGKTMISENIMVQEGAETVPKTAEGVSHKEEILQKAADGSGEKENVSVPGDSEKAVVREAQMSGKPGTFIGRLPDAAEEQGMSRTVLSDGGNGAMSVPAETRGALTDNMLQVLNELQMSPEEAEALSEAVQRFGRGELSAGDFFRTAQKMLDAAGHTEGGAVHIQKLFGGKEFQNILISQLKGMWTLRPEDVSQPEKVEELYRRIDRQMKGLINALEAGGQGNSTAYRAASNLSQNVDFMNQINQMYTYVQLPLHLQQSEAHGDLYVYTNKRSLAENKGQVSALLHLDMEHLGPLDVYVTLQEAKVSTKFYVADDEILDFIEGHMDILTKRLERRGYSCSVSMTARGEKEEQEGGGLSPLLQQEKGILLSQYAFDVRT